MAIITSNVAATYDKSSSAIASVLNSIRASENCLSSRVVAHYAAYKKYPHYSKNGSSSGQMFEMIFTEALNTVGVKAHRQKLHVKHEKTNVEVDVFVVGAKRPIIILLKASLRERWKQEDRDALAIKYNSKGCADALYEQVGLGRYDSAYPPIIWAVTWRERESVSAEDACAAAKKIGEKCTGVDTDRFVSVFDKERMDALVAECKEAQ